jgi:hypothetical protein
MLTISQSGRLYLYIIKPKQGNHEKVHFIFIGNFSYLNRFPGAGCEWPGKIQG